MFVLQVKFAVYKRS